MNINQWTICCTIQKHRYPSDNAVAFKPEGIEFDASSKYRIKPKTVKYLRESHRYFEPEMENGKERRWFDSKRSRPNDHKLW